MEQMFFPVTKRESERSGSQYSSEANKNAGFPSRLRKLRKEKGVSQEIASKKLGISKSTVGLWETGDTLPDAKAVCDLAVYYGVSTDYLLGKTDIKSTDANLKSACDYTGLSELAIKNICVARETDREAGITQGRIAFGGGYFVNKFFESPEFYQAMLYVWQAVYADSMKFKLVPLLHKKENKTQEEQDFIDELTEEEKRITKLVEEHGKVLLEGNDAAEYFVLKAKEVLNRIIDDVFSLSAEEINDILSPYMPK